MAGFSVIVTNQTKIDTIRVIGVSVNPKILFSVDAKEGGQGTQNNLQARGSRGLVIYDLHTNDIIFTGTVIVPDHINHVTILVVENSAGQFLLDFAFDSV